MKPPLSSTRVIEIASRAHAHGAAAFGAIALIGVVMIPLRGCGEQSPEPAPISNPESVSVSALNLTPATPAPNDFPWPQHVTRDPFNRPVPHTPTPSPTPAAKEKGAAPEATLKLSSILYAAQPRAMINGVVVKIGDCIEGFKVVAIDRRSVTLKKDGKVTVLHL